MGWWNSINTACRRRCKRADACQVPHGHVAARGTREGMRLVSPFLTRVVYPSLSRSGYLRQRAGSFPAVVTYHGVLPEAYRIIDAQLDGNLLGVEALRRQLRYLKVHYEVVSPEDFRGYCEGRAALPSRAVLLTCDDGLRNNLTEMLPVLEECAVKCLFFVTGASLEEKATMLWHEQLYLQLLAAPDTFTLDLREVGVRDSVQGLSAKRNVWWKLVELLSVYDGNCRWQMLDRVRQQLGLPDSWDAEYRENSMLARRWLTLRPFELRQLAAGGMCIGAHTTTHPRLSRMPDALAMSELSENRRNLERVLGQEVWALAYPFGDSGSVSAREMAFARQSGFRCAFLNEESTVGAGQNWFAWPRVHVTKEMGLAELEAHISGFHRSLRELLSPASLSPVVGWNA